MATTYSQLQYNVSCYTFQMLIKPEVVWHNLSVKDLYRTRQHSDVQIFTSDGVLELHKLILAAASEFLKVCLLSADEKDTEISAISLPDYTRSEVETLLAFLYGQDEELGKGAKSLYWCLFPPSCKEDCSDSEPLVKVELDNSDGGDNLKDSDNDFDIFGELGEGKNKRGKRRSSMSDYDDEVDEECSKRRKRAVRPVKLPSGGRFNCSDCAYDTLSKSEFIQHVTLHKKVFCTECQKVLKCRAFRKHCEKMHLAECLECRVTFNERNEAADHIAKVHAGETFRHCSHCQIKWGSDETVQTHEMNCVYLTVEEIERERTRRPKKDYCVTKNLPFPIDESKPNECPAEGCPYTSSERGRLRNHYFVWHCRQKCPYCDKVLGVFHLEDHVINMHTKKYQFVCEICSQGFFRKNKLQNHMEEEHIRDPKYVCDLCGEKFFGRAKLATHKHHHHTQHKCLWCEKVYKSKKSLIKHLNSQHHGVGIAELFKDKYGKYKRVRALKDFMGNEMSKDVNSTVLGPETVASHIY